MSSALLRMRSTFRISYVRRGFNPFRARTFNFEACHLLASNRNGLIALYKLPGYFVPWDLVAPSIPPYVVSIDAHTMFCLVHRRTELYVLPTGTHTAPLTLISVKAQIHWSERSPVGWTFYPGSPGGKTSLSPTAAAAAT